MEELFLQILLISTIIFILTTHSFLRKLWGFSSIIIILGLMLGNIGYELFISFLWLIELGFIIVFILLLTSFNASLKPSSPAQILFVTNWKFIFLLFILTSIFCILVPMYLYSEFYVPKIKATTHLDLVSNTYFTDYYKENQANGLILSDLKGLGFSLFYTHFFSLFTFLILLTLASFLIVIIQLQVSIKKSFNNTLLIASIIKNRLKFNTNKEFMNKEILEHQLKIRNGLRVVRTKKK